MREIVAAVAVLLVSALLGSESREMNPGVPCEDECRRVLTVCISDGTETIVEPKPKELAECARLCRTATPRRFYSCVFRQFYCEGFFPCIGGQ